MIGGRIIDPGALAALLDGSIYMSSWLTVARTDALTLFIPDLARAEVAALRPHQAALLQLLADNPQVVIEPLSRADADAVEQLLADAQVWDATAGAVVHAAHRRGWQIIAGDPGRLTRIDPNLDIDAL